MPALSIHLRSVVIVVFALMSLMVTRMAVAQTPVETRMKGFLLALDKRNSSQLVSFFHPQKKIHFRSSYVDSGKFVGSSEYTRSQISAQLRSRTSFAYHHFFDEPNGHTFRADWSSDTKLRMSPIGTFRGFYVPDTFMTYIRWEQFKGVWFIVELGETLS